MNRRIAINAALLASVLAVAPATGAGDVADQRDEADWRLVAEPGGLRVWRRDGPGRVDVLRAEGRIAYPAAVVLQVLMDAGRYQEFMPYTTESRLLDSGPGRRLSYQRVSSPLVSDRDYVIALTCHGPADSTGYRVGWTAVDDVRAPVREGVVRVTLNRGYWELQPVDHATTRARYYLETDPGGSLPAFVANLANTQAIPRIYAAVRARAALPQYRDPAVAGCP